MSLDMFMESEPKQVFQTPLMKAPRTPPMTPSRSGRRRNPTTPAPKTASKYYPTSQPVRREDFYDLRTRQVPLSNSELWKQFGITEQTKNRKEVSQENMISFTAAKQEKQSWVFNFTRILWMVCVLVLSAFLGACCYAYVQHHFMTSDHCVPQGDRVDRSEDLTTHLKNSVIRLAEEVKHLKDYYNKIQDDLGSKQISQPQKGILEELLVPDLASAGNLGTVLATPDTTLYTIPATVTVLWLFSFGVQVNRRPPQTTIEGLIQEVGDCWPFHGSRGRLVLKLHRRSLVTGVSLSHIPPSLIVSGDISSAPRMFQVLVHQWHEDDFDHGLLLGEFEYSTLGPWRQTFNIKPRINDDPVEIVEFRFLTNHGHPNYTCVYRVHVHGHPQSLNL